MAASPAQSCTNLTATWIPISEWITDLNTARRLNTKTIIANETDVKKCMDSEFHFDWQR